MDIFVFVISGGLILVIAGFEVLWLACMSQRLWKCRFCTKFRAMLS